MKKSTSHIYLIILLSILSSVAPIATDTYLPSIPEIAKYFDVNIHKIELSLSIFLIGFAVGQIFGGPISDRYGRRFGSILGLIGFAFFSFLIIFSSNVYELWIYRFLEAFFGGITVVNAAAAVRDRFKGQEAAKVFSLIGIIRSIAPLLAPVFGALIIHFYPWEGIFVFLTIYSLFVAFLVYKDLPESFVKSDQKVLESYKSVLTHKKAMKAMLVLAISFGGFFILIAKTSFIYIEYFGIKTDYFPLFFGINFIILMFMIKVNVNLLKKYNALSIVKFAILFQIVVGLIFILIHQNITLIQTVIVLAAYMSMMAFVFGNCMAIALEHFSKNAGVASGVIGVLQFGLGALISSIALYFDDNGFFIIAFSITLLSFISYLIIRSYKA
ncbi:multidrug effflux MFS transporter [Aliarcobacter skirrowii]|jgi:DHA1 family bicyclomycin/chloramphenicol resistance-like MFS transporter|uniref:Bcr/CflA family drug resistance efflux transporter n=1 Tax=Aliarcobacter skirrowii CCUG 10374 TaxID=1032239 RepID=A0AAD0SNC9_9BACT|nr:multidrug effflux MFS transporter [Aliarcobacter skirrowii]AXX85749.1 drug resistance transporter, Bcr/CflA family [Aliarcobacter skirrowii CCUG 10374]AZL54802.1 Bcr/CflA family efflux MFS transporter [Aliarcobacter skirrowii]KAB0622009.1 multidrug effflux MFS transporter [Aliarcobacter skirrowii CCUG 10374]MDX4025116.1 multidrug effflux MFS transporter [Aliarcobacter skirrowii]RXI27259.1 Bcr/CflA family drug resistance efflux transporter [Aliarcobacter skirrowii CCUG 10374]